jgi:uncharacterized membrane protein
VLDAETFAQSVADVGRVLDALGVAVIAVCAVAQLTRYVRALARHRGETVYRSVRAGVGRGVLLGLEVLVAGDIVRTVGANPTLESWTILASIVGIRSFLSFTIGVETEGHWPWSPGPAAIGEQ